MGRPIRNVDKPKEEPKRKRVHPPAKTLEARENQLISLAMDVAEQKLRDGTASSQLITEFVRRGSTKDRLEKEILEKNRELLHAKTDAIKSSQTVEELYKNALDAMRRYSGSDMEEDYEH